MKEAPDAGESSLSKSPDIESSKVTHIVNNTIYGDHANVVGSAHGSTITFNISAYDFDSLARALREKGVQEDDIKDLKIAVELDPEPTDKAKLGAKVSAWIGRMLEKASTGSWDITIQAAATLLAAPITKYYGLG